MWFKYVRKLDNFIFCRLLDYVIDDEGVMLEFLVVVVYSCCKGKVGLGIKFFICGVGLIEIKNEIVLIKVDNIYIV